MGYECAPRGSGRNLRIEKKNFGDKPNLKKKSKKFKSFCDWESQNCDWESQNCDWENCDWDRPPPTKWLKFFSFIWKFGLSPKFFFQSRDSYQIRAERILIPFFPISSILLAVKIEMSIKLSFLISCFVHMDFFDLDFKRRIDL